MFSLTEGVSALHPNNARLKMIFSKRRENALKFICTLHFNILISLLDDLIKYEWFSFKYSCQTVFAVLVDEKINKKCFKNAKFFYIIFNLDKIESLKLCLFKIIAK